MQVVKIDRDEGKIEELLSRGVVEVVEKEHLKEALLSGRQLRVKLGIDPTAADLHLGHSVVLRKLKAFQDLGHKIVLIIGDFTAQVGDPSGKNELRPTLNKAEIKANFRDYKRQASKVLDLKKAEVVYNSKWFKRNALTKMMELSKAGSIQQMLRRKDFRDRIEAGKDLSLLETLYPLLQGYDSVEVKADVELGGTDQTFNLLMGRKVQRHFGVKEQDILTMELLEGTDGKKKMSKSLGNYVGLDEEASEMFGKLMSVPDELVKKYFLLCTDLSEEEIEEIAGGNPKEAKERLADEIVSMYHGSHEADKAKAEFGRMFSEKALPSKIETIRFGASEGKIVDFLVMMEGVESKTAAIKLIEQKGVKLNGRLVEDPAMNVELKGDTTVQVGKRRFSKFIP